MKQGLQNFYMLHDLEKENSFLPNWQLIFGEQQLQL